MNDVVDVVETGEVVEAAAPAQDEEVYCVVTQQFLKKEQAVGVVLQKPEGNEEVHIAKNVVAALAVSQDMWPMTVEARKSLENQERGRQSGIVEGVNIALTQLKELSGKSGTTDVNQLIDQYIQMVNENQKQAQVQQAQQAK